MRIPTLYYVAGGAILAALLALVVSFKAHDRRVAERAAAHTRIERDSSLIASLQKRLHASDTAVTHNIGRTANALTVYDTIRVRVTSKPITDTVIVVQKGDTVQVVPAGYVRAADATAQACRLLERSCAEFRLVADSTMAAQARVITDLRIVGRKKSHWYDVPLHIAIGAGIGFAAAKL